MAARSTQLAGLVLIAVGALILGGCSSEPELPGAPPSMYRLTEQQYRNVIADTFGSHIVVAGTFYPILRKEGLIAVGAREATISALSFERFEKLARSIAEQVLNDNNRSLYLPCKPDRTDAPDDVCAQAFVKPVGRLLFRRPLSEAEVAEAVQLAATAGEDLNDFYGGLEFALASLLLSPNFLFVIEDVAEGADQAAELNAFSKATRLSFFLWNTTPDHELLDAAESGELDTAEGLEAQVERLMASPRLRQGVRAFFSDMLHLDELDHLEKDNLIYPAFDPKVNAEAGEQLLRTIVHHLLDEAGDYRTLFSTRRVFMNGALGRVYRVPVADPELWTIHEFGDDDARAGIHTLAGFVALHSHPGRSSPTIRGKAVRELLLCQKVPDPPGDVDFSLFTSTEETQNARERLQIHNSIDSCAGCHKLTDEIGLSLENFDGAGQFRTMDAGSPIDPSGTLDGVDYEDSVGLAQALSDNEALPECLVQKLFSYSYGRAGERENRPLVAFLAEAFASDGYQLKPLLHRIATSTNFFAVAPPTVSAPRDEVSSL